MNTNIIKSRIVNGLLHVVVTLCAPLCANIAWAGDAVERNVQFDINVKHIGAEILPTMYGLFFEDINFGADGGLYAEMIKNRSFEFPDSFMGWRRYGNVELLDDGPFERNPHYVRLSATSHPKKYTGIDNEGFFGVAFEADSSYRFSVWARSFGTHKSRIRVELADPAADGDTQVCAAATIEIPSSEWTKYTAILKPDKTVAKGRLRIFLDSQASADLEHVSLFPVNTWNGHENGLRHDLAELLSELKPGVFRFPGGCIVEGTDIATRYRWKNTVGPVENRPLNENRWHYSSLKRFYPDYYQTAGLGFYEYFLLSEELGAEPLPVINVGMACQYQNKSADAHVPVDSLGDYIQDAEDLIEFANGDTTTTWGALRALMGHSAPFGLRFIAIGNEQWGPEYVERLEPFVRALRTSHPEIKIVGSSGPGSEGDKFEYLWPEMKRLKVDLVDEHFYRPEEWFLSQARRYDNYDRRGPKVFAGEYACHTAGLKRNNFRAALCEAAFMTGMERNADIVTMATYAPLLAHVEGWQWRPDMIWFDNLRSVPTSSYYVQQLFATNRGSHVISLTMNGEPVAGQDGLYASAVKAEVQGEYIVKIVNTTDVPVRVKLNFNGMKKRAELAGIDISELATANPCAENTLDTPDVVVPVAKSIKASGKSACVQIAANALVVCRITTVGQ